MSWYTIGWLNAGLATALALVLLPLRNRVAPATLHALWLIVLVKLITPPLVTIPLAVNWLMGGTWLSSHSLSHLTGEIIPLSAASWCLASLWLIGSLCVVVAQLLAAGRYLWTLQQTTAAAPPEITRLVQQLAASLGLLRSPAVRLSHTGTPHLFGIPGWAVLVIPRTMLALHDKDVQQGFLRHELAHYARRDHWIRTLEIAVQAVYWWLPTTWWAIARLRELEDECSDGWAIQDSSVARRAYAEGLLNVVAREQLSCSVGDTFSTPALCSLVTSQSNVLKRRLRLIMRESVAAQLSSRTRRRVGAFAAMILLLFPVPDLISAEPASASLERLPYVVVVETQSTAVAPRPLLTRVRTLIPVVQSPITFDLNPSP
ncbi:MAG: M56 family metallopeptidase [Planctomycetaceae bacterium]|nr:M56 family metallopeptidase [Planctomycetaceae bacterium]